MVRLKFLEGKEMLFMAECKEKKMLNIFEARPPSDPLIAAWMRRQEARRVILATWIYQYNKVFFI